jgi:hypothetical protein
MSEPTEVWGVRFIEHDFDEQSIAWWSIHDDEDSAREVCDNDCPGGEVVQLFPAPEVDRQARDQYAIWSRWVWIVTGLVKELPDDQRERFVIACRNYKGPCFCGCHTSEAQS